MYWLYSVANHTLNEYSLLKRIFQVIKIMFYIIFSLWFANHTWNNVYLLKNIFKYSGYVCVYFVMVCKVFLSFDPSPSTSIHRSPIHPCIIIRDPRNRDHCHCCNPANHGKNNRLSRYGKMIVQRSIWQTDIYSKSKMGTASALFLS